MIRMHPESDLLVEYATGSLSLAPCISVTTHLQFCDACSRSVESLKDIGGDLLETSEAMPVSDELFDRILNCIETSAESDVATQVSSEPSAKSGIDDEITSNLPDYVRNLLPGNELSWRKLSSSLRVAPISVGEDRFELALHRITAGGKAPEHGHTGQEITVVLKGSFSDEDGVYQPGDFIIREAGDTHRPFAAQNEECICLSVLAAPIKLTGIKRLLNPFLSFSPS